MGIRFFKARMVVKWGSKELLTIGSIIFTVCRSHQNNLKVIGLLLFHFIATLTLEDPNPMSDHLFSHFTTPITLEDPNH